MTVAQLLGSIGSHELMEWEQYAQLEPFGPMIEDLRAGLAPAATINANRDPEKSKPVGPLDLYPWHNPSAKPTSPATAEERAQAIARILGRKPENESQ